MKTRWIIGLVLAAALLGMAWLTHEWLSHVREGRVRGLESQLRSGDLSERLAAATTIVRLSPDHVEARMTRAQALIEMGKADEARGALAELLEDADYPRRTEAIRMMLDQLLTEASEMILSAPVGGAEMAHQRVEKMLEKTAGLREELRSTGTPAQDLLALEGAELDLRAALLDTQWRAASFELGRSRGSRTEEFAQTAGAELVKLRKQAREIDGRLTELCDRMSKLAPRDPRPAALMFQVLLRAERPADARAMAQRVLGAEQLDRALAGEVAGTLMTLDRTYGVSTTAQDVKLAGQLLSHPGLTGPLSLRSELVEARMSLRAGDTAKAAQQARTILDHADGHPGATCLLAETMILENRPREAIALVGPLIERVGASELLEVMGVAQMATGEMDRGRDYLRQALDSEPQNLAARLRLIESLLSAGAVLDAEPHIRAALAQSPRHPRVRAARIRLAVERLDTSTLTDLVRQGRDDRSSVADWTDAAIAAALVMDDLQLVRQLEKQRLATFELDPLALVAQACRKASPVNRFEIASAVAWTMLDRLDTQPLRRPAMPELPPMIRVPGITPIYTAGETGAGGMTGLRASVVTSQPAAALSSLDARLFIPTTLSLAGEVIDLALMRAPDEPVLLDLAARVALWQGRPRDAIARLRQLGQRQPSTTVLVMRRHLGLTDSNAAATQPSESLGDATLRGDLTPTVQLVQLLAALERGDAHQTTRGLEQMLGEHPGAEAALLIATQHAASQGRHELIEAYFEACRPHNPRMTALAEARWRLARGQANEAVQQAGALLHDRERELELRRQASEIIARGKLMMGNLEQAAGVFESLAVAGGDTRHAMRQCAFDVRFLAGRAALTPGEFTRLFAEPQMPARNLDQLLTRGLVLMDAPRFLSLVEALLQGNGEDAVLLFYKALALDLKGDHAAAATLAKRVFARDATAVRAGLLGARASLSAGQADEARRIYQEIIASGDSGASGRDEARQALEEMGASSSAKSSSAANGGGER